MSAQFVSGDLVQLKSGGPEMTVDSLLSTGEYLCKWFGGKKLESGRFQPDTLKLSAPKPQ